MSLVEDLNPRAMIGGNNPPAPVQEVAPQLTVEDEIEEALAPFKPRIDELVDKATALPKVITCKEEKDSAGDVAKAAHELCREIEASRKVVKKPYLDACKLVEDGFSVPKDRLDTMAKRIEDRASAYDREQLAQQRRAAEEVARKAREEEQRRAELAEKAAQDGRQAHAALHEDRADAAADRAAHAEALARKSSVDLTRTRSAAGTVGSASTKWKGEIVDIAVLDIVLLRPFLKRDALQAALDGYVRVNCKGEMEAPVVAGARIFADVQTRFR